MTRLDPSLRLSRLVVIKDGRRAYDEKFHAGVNIIRGVESQGNSVGKSTIADMIFFALGGDLTKWKEEAKLCDYTFAELVLNGNTVTVSREISAQTRRPMSIFYGDFETAHASAADGWQIYPYQRYQDRQSFTQVIFRLLDMPEVPAETEANITVHQLLRLMYVDQMTPVDRIFRSEDKDSGQRRQAVGDLLCGVFDERIYPAQIELRAKEKDYEVAAQQFVALSRALTKAGEAFNLDFVEARKREVQKELVDTRSQIEELRKHRFDTNQNGEDQDLLDALQHDLEKTNSELIVLRSSASAVTYAIEDAELLIEETERVLTRLKEGEMALSAIGPIAFAFCPSCFSELDDATEHQCKLCRKDLDPNVGQARVARMRNELSMQLIESKRLQETRRANFSALRTQISKMQAVRNTLAHEFLSIGREYVTEADAQIDRLNARVGYLERELVDIAREADLAEQLSELSERKKTLNEEMQQLRSNIGIWKEQKDRRQGSVYRLITNNTAEILENDLLTEEGFSSSSDVYFDFAEDRIAVNGKTGFSASSLTLLRNAFHLALHLASCESATMRYPRFLLMDNIEDKGMTEARSQNFQRHLVRLSEELDVEHQIIFTTSMIDTSLDIEKYTVGDKYDFNNKSLKIGRPGPEISTDRV